MVRAKDGVAFLSSYSEQKFSYPPFAWLCSIMCYIQPWYTESIVLPPQPDFHQNGTCTVRKTHAANFIIKVGIGGCDKVVMTPLKVHGANMGPTWVLSSPDGPHVGPMNLAIGMGISHNNAHDVVSLLKKCTCKICLIKTQCFVVPCLDMMSSVLLQWRHNGRDSVSNHQPHDCLINRLFRRRSKKTSKLRVTGLCAWNSPGTGEFPAQMASNAENVSIWWRHHVTLDSRHEFAHIFRVTSPSLGR